MACITSIATAIALHTGIANRSSKRHKTPDITSASSYSPPNPGREIKIMSSTEGNRLQASCSNLDTTTIQLAFGFELAELPTQPRQPATQ